MSNRSVVGISGVYDVNDHYLHESSRGVEHVSKMWRSVNGCALAVSPSALLADLSLPTSLLHQVKFYLVHARDDSTVPVSSTEKFNQALREQGMTTTAAFPAGGHADLIMSLMKPPHPLHLEIWNIVQLALE